MYGLHKAFVAEIAKAPAALLRQVISEKLASEGHAHRAGFVEALQNTRCCSVIGCRT